MSNIKKRRKAKIKQYIPDYISESGQIDGKKLGLAMLKLAQGALDKVKAKQAAQKSSSQDDK